MGGGVGGGSLGGGSGGGGGDGDGGDRWGSGGGAGDQDGFQVVLPYERCDNVLLPRAHPAWPDLQGMSLLASAAVAHPLMDLAASIDSKRMLVILCCLVLPVLGCFLHNQRDRKSVV